MSKRLIAITMLLALTVVPFAVAQEEAAKAPRVTLVEPLKDFGTVAKGEKLEYPFQIKNTGTSDLEILAAKPTCGCTVADFDKVIKPGQIGKVTAVVDTAALNGPITKAVTIETNDPTTPTAQVTITAVVKPYVEAYPAGFVRYQILQGDVEKQSVTLYSEENEPFEILKIETPQEWIKVEHKKIEGLEVVPNIGRQSQNQHRIDVTVGGPDATIGPIAEKIRILTNSKHQPEYLLTVAGVVRPTFRVEPTMLNFGEVAPADTAATRTILLRSNNMKTPEAFQVTNAASSLAGVSVAVKPTANKGEYEVTVQVNNKSVPGAIDGTVVIETNDKVKPTVTIPVKGMVKAPAVAAN